jgi:flagellar hook-basal body complex protein FliE
MTDPLGLIGGAGGLHPQGPGFRGPQGPDNRPDFGQLLQEQIARVNALQQDAKAAVEDLAAGRRDDVESVIIATQKADTAFRMLLQVRNKMMDAYQEIREMRI